MIVLDTNVVSEAMKPEPDAALRAWLNDQAAETLYLSSVTLAELLFGIRALPAGKRRSMLDRALNELLELFQDRVLPFDTDAARHYADLAVTAGAAGVAFRHRTATSLLLQHRGASSWRHVTHRLTKRLA
jgi:predicted nucleic acid-binding protein